MSGAQIVTVAVRRVNIGQDPSQPNLLDVLPADRYTILPNTAGCHTAEEAVRTCRLARELLDGHNLVKLEVLADHKTLYPDVTETLAAAQTLIADGFEVMVYTSDDPILAQRFEAMGCVAVMPLAAPIGSGLGIRNPYNLHLILEQATVPILVDAGVGTASDAAHRHGAGLRRRADEHGHRRRHGPGADGQRHAQGDRGRPRGVSSPGASRASSTPVGLVAAGWPLFWLKFRPPRRPRQATGAPSAASWCAPGA